MWFFYSGNFQVALEDMRVAVGCFWDGSLWAFQGLDKKEQVTQCSVLFYLQPVGVAHSETPQPVRNRFLRVTKTRWGASVAPSDGEGKQDFRGLGLKAITPQ